MILAGGKATYSAAAAAPSPGLFRAAQRPSSDALRLSRVNGRTTVVHTHLAAGGSALDPAMPIFTDI
jgi:hypothetical protein